MCIFWHECVDMSGTTDCAACVAVVIWFNAWVCSLWPTRCITPPMATPVNYKYTIKISQ